MKISDIKPAPYNPRKISDRQLQMLAKAMSEFGDLSGIVFNRLTGNLVGGHQRLKGIPKNSVIKKKDLKEKTKTGTVAEGKFLLMEKTGIIGKLNGILLRKNLLILPPINTAAIGTKISLKR